MAKFCTKCGAALSGVFCVKCGADMRSTAPEVQAQLPAPATSLPAEQPAPVSTPAANSPNKKMSTLAKLGIAAVVIIFVGGALAAGGVYYAAHRISQKIHEETGGLLGSSSGSDNSGSNSSSSDSSNNSLGNVCRFLSKEDVSKAIGVEIVRTQPDDNNCSYIAKGTQADMMAKHATAMTASRGADEKTQQMIQQITGGAFKVFQSENKDSKPDTGEVPVFNFSIDQNNADAQMRLNAKVMGRIGPTQDLPGIGDQAFVAADGMIMLRKGNKLVRVMFLSCPCGTEAVKPLAKEIADAL